MTEEEDAELHQEQEEREKVRMEEVVPLCESDRVRMETMDEILNE